VARHGSAPLLPQRWRTDFICNRQLSRATGRDLATVHHQICDQTVRHRGRHPHRRHPDRVDGPTQRGSRAAARSRRQELLQHRSRGPRRPRRRPCLGRHELAQRHNHSPDRGGDRVGPAGPEAGPTRTGSHRRPTTPTATPRRSATRWGTNSPCMPSPRTAAPAAGSGTAVSSTTLALTTSPSNPLRHPPRGPPQPGHPADPDQPPTSDSASAHATGSCAAPPGRGPLVGGVPRDRPTRRRRAALARTLDRIAAGGHDVEQLLREVTSSRSLADGNPPAASTTASSTQHLTWPPPHPGSRGSPTRTAPSAPSPQRRAAPRNSAAPGQRDDGLRPAPTPQRPAGLESASRKSRTPPGPPLGPRTSAAR
jgi:hypothetical protein